MLPFSSAVYWKIDHMFLGGHEFFDTSADGRSTDLSQPRDAVDINQASLEVRRLGDVDFFP